MAQQNSGIPPIKLWGGPKSKTHLEPDGGFHKWGYPNSPSNDWDDWGYQDLWNPPDAPDGILSLNIPFFWGDATIGGSSHESASWILKAFWCPLAWAFFWHTHTHQWFSFAYPHIQPATHVYTDIFAANESRKPHIKFAFRASQFYHPT